MVKREAFDGDDMAIMIALVASLSPENYNAAMTKAMIYRCKGIMEHYENDETIKVRIR